ncbi:MAG: suppressor of fused domain protein [Capsulimonas sp.]|uniref:suppressor of fused domain protein n=1 Tax=Capsulimonas sp. TaxID=2494211 RepID=UPI0032644A6F
MSFLSKTDSGKLKQSHEDIVQHMEQHYGPVQKQALVEIVLSSGIAIHAIPPRSPEGPLTLFTTGMSDRPQNVPAGGDEFRYTELLIQLPSDWPTTEQALRNENFSWPYKWLRQIAWYPHENDTWLGGPYPIIANDEPPQPLAPNTKLSCLLLIRETDAAGTVSCRDGRQIAFYSMNPLYTEERDFEVAQGIRPLFAAMAAIGATMVVDLHRPNAVTGS